MFSTKFELIAIELLLIRLEKLDDCVGSSPRTNDQSFGDDELTSLC